MVGRRAIAACGRRVQTEYCYVIPSRSLRAQEAAGRQACIGAAEHGVVVSVDAVSAAIE